MRLLKMFSVILALIAAALFGVTMVLEMRNSDTEGPVVSMDSDVITISVQDDENVVLDGVSAQDNKDGDVTASLLVENLSTFVDTGERIASIAAFDSDYHVTKTTRTVQYSDYYKPRFSLRAPLSFKTGVKSAEITQWLTAEDCLDGDVTHRIDCTSADGSPFNASAPGQYKVMFSVSNSAGDVEKFTATVEIRDDSATNLPTVTLTDGMIYLEKGSRFYAEDYLSGTRVDSVTYEMYNGNLITASKIAAAKREGVELPESDKEWEDMDEEERAEQKAQTEEMFAPEDILSWDNVTIRNPVNTDVPGWYEVSYTASSVVGRKSTSYLLVRVTE